MKIKLIPKNQKARKASVVSKLPFTDTEMLDWMEDHYQDIFVTGQRRKEAVLVWWKRHPLSAESGSAVGQSWRECIAKAMRQQQMTPKEIRNKNLRGH